MQNISFKKLTQQSRLLKKKKKNKDTLYYDQ